MIKQTLAALVLAASTLAGSAAIAQTGPLTFNLENATDENLLALYISLPSTDEWEEDLFGDGVLPPGNAVDVSIDDGLPECVYDIRADLEGGQSIQIGSVDFCELNGAELVVAPQ